MTRRRFGGYRRQLELLLAGRGQRDARGHHEARERSVAEPREDGLPGRSCDALRVVEHAAHATACCERRADAIEGPVPLDVGPEVDAERPPHRPRDVRDAASLAHVTRERTARAREVASQRRLADARGSENGHQA